MAKIKNSIASKITIPVGRLRNGNWLASLGRLILIRPLAPKDVFALVRLSKQVERESVALETTRRKLIERHGEKDGTNFTVKESNRAAFQKDWESVLSEAIVLALPNKIALPENFESGNGTPNTTLTAGDILLLAEIVIAPGE